MQCLPSRPQQKSDQRDLGNIDDDDGDDDPDEMCAGNIPLDKQKCVLIPGKYSLIRAGEVEEPREQASNNADEAPIQAKSVVKTN